MVYTIKLTSPSCRWYIDIIYQFYGMLEHPDQTATKPFSSVLEQGADNPRLYRRQH